METQSRVPSQEADYDPLCPHCEAELTAIHWRRMEAFFAKEYLFICPHCKKVIGVTSSR